MSNIRRRELMVLLGGAAALPLAARAQQPDRVRRVGVLMGISDDPEGQARIAVFRQSLQALGWTEGRNVQFIYRWSAGDVVHARQFAKELLDLRSDVILANSTPIAVAVRDITRTTPTVFVQVSDPITAGVVLRLIERDAVITIIDARDHVGRILGGLGSQGPDCVAGHVGLELRNVGKNYPFERSRRFPGILANSSHRDYSLLSCGGGETQLGPSAGISAGFQGPLRRSRAPPARSPIICRFLRATVVLLQHFNNFERKPHCRADCLVCYSAHSTKWGACHEHRGFDIDYQGSLCR
jgi:hypothetical protein